MAERRPWWRERAEAEALGFDWLRVELRNLDKRRADSLPLKVRTYLPRKRIMRDAIAYLDRQRAIIDAGLTDDARHLDGLRGVRSMRNNARNDYDRLWTANVWLASSAEATGQPDPILTRTSGYLSALAEKVARFPGGDS
jgi:hypothetical protein